MLNNQFVLLQVLNLNSCELDTVPGQLYGFQSLKVLNLGKLHDANLSSLAGRMNCQFWPLTPAQRPQSSVHNEPLQTAVVSTYYFSHNEHLQTVVISTDGFRHSTNSAWHLVAQARPTSTPFQNLSRS